MRCCFLYISTPLLAFNSSNKLKQNKHKQKEITYTSRKTALRKERKEMIEQLKVSNLCRSFECEHSIWICAKVYSAIHLSATNHTVSFKHCLCVCVHFLFAFALFVWLLRFVSSGESFAIAWHSSTLDTFYFCRFAGVFFLPSMLLHKRHSVHNMRSLHQQSRNYLRAMLNTVE